MVLRSAALLLGDRRIPIGSHGLSIGSGPEADVDIDGTGAGLAANIEPTPDGHVVVEVDSQETTFANGERLVPGERRPLQRGDTIAVGGTLLHYLPGGAAPRPLNPVSAVDAGRVRTGHRPFTIGRSDANDLVLDHPTISREHAVITRVNDHPLIEAVAGVPLRINGVPSERQRLQPGDQIAIGPYRIVFDGEELIERSAAVGLPVVAMGAEVTVDQTTILQPTSLQLRPAELVAVIGASGAGKSTLLKALAGVIRLSSGRVLAGGEDIAQRLTEIGYVPQSEIVHGELTAREALDFSAQLRLPSDTSYEERAQRVERVLDQLAILDRAHVRVGSLSGGQRKRVAVGVELLHRPGAMFLDEPTTGLDPGLERRTMELFRTLADRGQTVAVVTHATASIELCDRVIVMGEGGRVRFDGTPAELLSSFGIDSFDEAYGLVDPRPDEPMTQRHPNAHSLPVLPPIRGMRERPIQQPLGFQTRVLARRYGTLVTRNRSHLRSALIQVPVLAVLTALLFKSDVFMRTDGGHVPTAAKAAQMMFLMVTVAVWLGAIYAAREIVKERSVVSRELAIGVSPVAYLLSKLGILVCLVSVQTVVFGLIVIGMRPLHAASGAGTQLLLILAVSGCLGILIGLLVSAFSRSEDQATGLIPLVLIPQLLLGGAIVTLHEMSGAMAMLANAIPARWAFAAAGHGIEMNARIAEDDRFAKVSGYGSNFFETSPTTFMIVAAIFGAILFAVLLRRVGGLRNADGAQ